MYKIGKSLLVTGLFVSAIQAQEGLLEQVQKQLAATLAQAKDQAAQAVTFAQHEATVAKEAVTSAMKTVADAKTVANAKEAATKTAQTEAQKLATLQAKVVGQPSSTSIVTKANRVASSVAKSAKETVSSAAKATKAAVKGTTDVVVSNVSAMFDYLVKVGVNDPKVSNTRFYLVQGGKVIVITAATAYALYYAYNQVYGEQTKSVVDDTEDVLVVE